jgi:hypothetical protein
MLQDADGQVIEAVSISAGLDYPGIGPQLAALMQAGRLIVSSATDTEAVAAMRQVARTEGILAAVESAHAVAALPDVLARTAVEEGSGSAAADARGGGHDARGARQRVAGGSPGPSGPLPREAVVVLGLSGRGDKDLAALAEAPGGKVSALDGAQGRAPLGQAQSRAALAETGDAQSRAQLAQPTEAGR